MRETLADLAGFRRHAPTKTRGCTERANRY
jgi:hypothetical protein